MPPLLCILTPQTLQVTVHDAQADPILKAHFPEYFPDKHGESVDWINPFLVFF